VECFDFKLKKKKRTKTNTKANNINSARTKYCTVTFFFLEWKGEKTNIARYIPQVYL